MLASRLADRWGVVLLLLVLVCFWFESWTPRPQFDDAYISYRYARNLVEGHGLVFNIGERVEGFTNLLWTLLIAAGLALGGQATQVAHALALGSGTAALVAAYLYAGAGLDRSRHWIAVIAPFLLFVWIGFPMWTLSGLETPLFAAAVGGALAAEAHGWVGLATIAAVIATLTRPEGTLLVAVILAMNVLPGPMQRRLRVVAWGLAYAGFLAMLTGFRLYYYGSPVPNTFYAKTGSPVWLGGLSYLWAFMLSGAFLLFVPVLWAVGRDRRCWVGAVWSVAMGFYIVSVGGDAFPHHRFWVPVYLVLAALAVRALILQREVKHDWRGELPLWAFVVGAGGWSLVSAQVATIIFAGLWIAAMFGFWGRSVRRQAVSSALALGALSLLWFSAPWLDDAAFARRTAAVAYRIGRPVPATDESASRVRTMGLLVLGGARPTARQETLRAAWNARAFHLIRAEAAANRIKERLGGGEPIDLVAATAIGKFGYDLPIPILDLVGLVDAHIARSPQYVPTAPVTWLPGHTRTDSAYVFSRQPDYIFLQKRGTAPVRLPLHDDLWNNPSLDADYEFDEKMLAFRRKALPRPLPSGQAHTPFREGEGN